MLSFINRIHNNNNNTSQLNIRAVNALKKL